MQKLANFKGLYLGNRLCYELLVFASKKPFSWPPYLLSSKKGPAVSDLEPIKARQYLNTFWGKK
jgi:hypothetical protein